MHSLKHPLTLKPGSLCGLQVVLLSITQLEGVWQLLCFPSVGFKIGERRQNRPYDFCDEPRHVSDHSPSWTLQSPMKVLG